MGVSPEPSDPERSHRQLPQLRSEGGKYFITWRLNDQHDQLSEPERSMVAEELRRFHSQSYRLSIYVVMDDHVHVLVQTLAGCDLGRTMQRWKGATARAINLLRQTSGMRWQKACHTELLRNEAAVFARRQYIYENPQRRWNISPEDYQWLEWFE
jgi:REP element-mobilizing transposase RayT